MAIDPNEIENMTGHVAANLRALKGARRESDDRIAKGLGKSRNWVQERMSGTTPCRDVDLARFALYYGVPVGRFFEDPSGITSSYVEWVPDQELRAS